MSNRYMGAKYYSNNDMSIGYNLEKAETVINCFDTEKEYACVNEIIEFFNVQQLMDSGVLLKKWDEEAVSRLKNTCRQFSARIGRFFSKIDTTNFIDTFQSVDASYIGDFWLLFAKYKTFSRVDGNVLAELLAKGMAALWPLLEHKDIVSHYDAELASFMRTSDQSAELLLDALLAKCRRKFFFPKSLLPSEYEGVFKSYVDSNSPNPNYLNLIATSQSSAECPISDKLKQKARHRYDDEIKKRLSNSPGIEYGVGVGFTEMDSFMEAKKDSPLKPMLTYDTKWITENLDYPTILNNFRYLFDQVDLCWRSNLVSLKYHMGILERSLGIKGKKEYQIGMQFRVIDMASIGQIRGYRGVLSNNGVEIENVFKWFFEDYLKDEFRAIGFRFRASSPGASFVERVKNIASEMDSVLKQYRAFLEDGFVDKELLEMSSEHIVFSQLGSLLSNKYAYANSDELEREMHLLFSDQSHLTYTEKTETRYRAFFDLIINEQMTLDDFAHYQVEPIKWLIARGAIWEDEQRSLHIRKERCIVLKDVFIHEAICPNYYTTYAETIDELIRAGDLRYGNTLFSEPEQDYLNYMLNKSEYSNGLDLRNKYLHGTYPGDEKQQENDYDHLLLIMALAIMKINEEFCLKYPL